MNFFNFDVGLPATDPRLIIANLIHLALGFVGILLLLMILSAGFSFMVSGGDEEQITKAKKTLFNAIIGVLIILSANSIVSFVLNGLISATTGK